MNYGISVLFRAIPLVMALFCFFYGGYIYLWGDDSSRMIAGPVVFFLGSICIALFATAVTIIRQIIHTYNPFAKYSSAASRFSKTPKSPNFSWRGTSSADWG